MPCMTSISILLTAQLLPTSTSTNTLVMTTLPSTADNKEFVDFLFDKLFSHTDSDMLDLQDDDTCCDHVLFSQLELF